MKRSNVRPALACCVLLLVLAGCTVCDDPTSRYPFRNENATVSPYDVQCYHVDPFSGISEFDPWSGIGYPR